MRIPFLTFFLCTLVVVACEKTNPPVSDAVAATLHDYTGLAGCTWVIKLEKGDVLEPINLNEFISSPAEGKKIWIRYTVMNDLASICMVGQIIRIDSCWDR